MFVQTGFGQPYHGCPITDRTYESVTRHTLQVPLIEIGKHGDVLRTRGGQRALGSRVWLDMQRGVEQLGSSLGS